MSRIPLTGKAYVERSIIAGAMETINWYAEENKDETRPVPFTYYPTPGSILFNPVAPAIPAKNRCTYRTSTGLAYTVIGAVVYFVSTNGALTEIGVIGNNPSQCYMADNGIVAVLVDGTSNGYVIELATNKFASIVDPSFYGANFVVYLLTFFIFNRPGTNQFYISLSQVSFGMLAGTAIGTGTITAAGTLYTNGVYQNVSLTGGSGTGATADITITGGAVTAVDIDNPGEGYLVGDTLSAAAASIGGTGSGFVYTVDTTAPAFDPLDIAAKSGSADPIVAILSIHQELWLVGALTTEVWQGTGAADFFFQQVQGAYIEHGCIAQYTASNTDVLGFWLMQDKQGKNIVVQGSGYDVEEISTPFLVDRFNTYATTNDAIGFCFQIDQHAFYCLMFPTANETWLFEIQTKQWNKWAWLNQDDGSLNRHRANCGMFFNEQVIIGDWENGNLYKLDAETFTDNLVPIVRIKTFLHMIQELNRVTYRNFDLDIEPATQNPDLTTEPVVTLCWSDDRGKTYSFPIEQTLGQGGDYLTTVSWNRLGMARDRIFKIQTSEPIRLALNGGFSDPAPHRT